MNCQECDAPMFRGEVSVTLVGYINTLGPEHDHDDNCKKREYRCSRDPFHEPVMVSIRRTCPACDWKGKTKCFCHPGEKVNEWP